MRVNRIRFEIAFPSIPEPVVDIWITLTSVLSKAKCLPKSFYFSQIAGVNFYPSAEMWLGPHFWQYAKCTKEEVLAADFFIDRRDTPHFLYLKCWPQPFTRPDGEQGRIQQKLWKLFFHEDCEWPPGSGGIADVPMYGPPELMPPP